MKKTSYVFILIFSMLSISFTAKSQILLAKRIFYLAPDNNPQQTGPIKFIDYFNGGTWDLDTSTYHDFSMTHDVLVAAGNTINVYHMPAMADTGMDLQHTIPNANALKAMISPSWSAVLAYCADTPYFRNYFFSGSVLTMDTTLAPYGIVDMMTYMGDAYLLYHDHLRIIDVDNWTLEATLPTPTPFPFAGYNQWLILCRDLQGIDHIYIDIEYATGAPRGSLIELDPVNLTFDTVYHQEGIMNYYPPMVANGKVFMMHFNTHYDPITDSLYQSSFPFHPFHYLAGHCASDDSYYLFNTVNKTLYGANYNATVFDSVVINKDVKTFHMWWDVLGSVEDEIEAQYNVQIHTSPGGIRILADELFIKTLRIYDLSGRLVLAKNLSQKVSSSFLPFDGSGVFIVSLETEAGIINQKLLLSK